MNRRDFIKTAAGIWIAAGVPLLLPKRALAVDYIGYVGAGANYDYGAYSVIFNSSMTFTPTAGSNYNTIELGFYCEDSIPGSYYSMAVYSTDGQTRFAEKAQGLTIAGEGWTSETPTQYQQLVGGTPYCICLAVGPSTKYRYDAGNSGDYKINMTLDYVNGLPATRPATGMVDSDRRVRLRAGIEAVAGGGGGGRHRVNET